MMFAALYLTALLLRSHACD